MKRSVLFAKPLVKSSGIRVKPMQRSLTMLSSACKSPKTYENYLHHINKFREYFIIKNFDALISIGTKKLQTMIEDYTLYCRNQDYSASSMSSKISALDLFFSMSDITLNWKKIKKMLPERKKTLGEKPYTTEQINQILKNTTNLKFRAIVQFMASSGVRVGL